MQKLLVLIISIVFLSGTCLKAEFELINSKTLGAVYSPSYVNELSGKDKIDAERSISLTKKIIEDVNAIIKNYSTLTIAQKLSIMKLTSEGIKNSISYAKIGSGNVLIFSLLCDLHQLLLTDLTKEYDSNDKVKNEIKNFVDEQCPEISIEQINDLVLYEFHIKPDIKIKNTSQLLLKVINNNDLMPGSDSIFEQIMMLTTSNINKSRLNILDQLNNPDVKTLFILYAIAEIKNSFLKCGIKLKISPSHKMDMAEKYKFFRTTMNQLQKEIFNFTEPKYDKKTRVKYDILSMEKYAKRVPQNDVNKIMDCLKMRL
ncbi:MAG: hypothetical protein PHS31_06785 [Victivallaceae bacterium]|nr:hypothetical protein [Victivallaceae bacterium]